ncbi:hypothetical protein JXI42_11190 [bacterium]|nr:hypothetical protein [bacterium]
MKKMILLVLFILTTLLYSQIPRTMNYQGKLTDPDGVALDGSYSIYFQLYDVAGGGTPLWAESLLVDINNGLFDVVLGEVHPLNIDFSVEYYMQLYVEREELTPRTKLAPVAYAHRAIYADSAEVGVAGGVCTTARLTGDGAPGTCLDIAQQGASPMDVLTWTGSAWQPAPSSGGGDNNYVNAINFNTGSGVLTLFREGLSALNFDLDGRYIEQTSSAAWCDSTTFIHPKLTSTFKIEFDGDLDIGGANIERVNEISANNLDPVLKIGGRLYRTWAHDMVGQKTEAVGEAKLAEQGYYEIDLSTQPEASDLWLFYNAVDPTTIIPFVTPQMPANLYARIEGNKLIVGSSDGKGSIPFSFRLVGTRYDFRGMTQEETNRRTKSTDTFIDIDSGARYNQD